MLTSIMHKPHSMLVLLFTSFTLPLSSALTLDNPLPLLLPPPASAANNNTPMPMPMPNAPLPTAAAPHVSYICNGNAFGYGLDNDSCAQSVALVGISTTVLTFGMRSSAGRAYDIELPQRFISTDGKCVIEPSLTPGATEASASAEDIAVAAFVVVRNCVGGEGATGGIAKDIGAFGWGVVAPLSILPFLAAPLSLSLFPCTRTHGHTIREKRSCTHHDIMLST